MPLKVEEYRNLWRKKRIHTPNKLLVDVNGIEVKYIGLKEFIENKTASGRSQDIADLKEIKNIKKQ